MSKLHKFVAFALALSVLAILVSPFAASELTTIRAPQNTRPHVVAIPVALFASRLAWFHAPGHATWPEQQLVLGGSAIVDFTSARLC